MREQVAASAARPDDADERVRERAFAE